MKQLSLDFGGSTVDSVLWDGGVIKTIKTYESKDVLIVDAKFCRRKTVCNIDRSGLLENFLKFSKISLGEVERIFVTGGKSRFFPDMVDEIPIVKVSEIDAIGAGAEYRMPNAEYREEGRRKTEFGIRYSAQLVVSMGTGTCMVSVNGDRVKHVGGTGVGGGTFVGLGRELLGISDIDELLKIAAKGSSKNVDVSVSDIVGGAIGRAAADATASNLGKLRDEIKFRKEDLAAGIVNLIGQTIGISAVFAAKAEGFASVVLIGKLTKAKAISNIVCDIIRSYGLEVCVSENAQHAVAIGARVAGERMLR